MRYITYGVTRENMILIFSSIGSQLCSLLNTYEVAMPTATPPTTIHKKSPAASYQTNCPMPTDINANLTMISELASLKRLSPSKIAEILRGTFTNFIIAAALTASGGDTIPPKRKPKGIEKPGMKWLAMNATTDAVMNTTMKANDVMMRRHRHNSFHELDIAASYKIGGRKIRKMTSGLIVIFGMPGMRLKRRPATTKRMG